MKRLFVTFAIVSLALPATALAKGPSEATISGGGGGNLTITGCCEPGSPAMNLAEQAGFFPAVFGQQPDPMLDRRPRAELGPKYTITYTVPGPNNETWFVRQDVYPYASPVPVTYTAPGQDVFETDGTPGGWYQASPELKETLVAAGLPANPPPASSDGWEFPTAPVGVLLAGLVVIGAAALLVRRRIRPAAA
ncbi:MAG TPA: hypothetical protein VFL61_02610 [Gaiellaceae bacterium]|nr:hypothetical protein [Gaiellaceae bacterium]